VLESTSPGIADPARRAERLVADRLLAEAIERDGVPAFVDRWERLPLWASQRALPEAAHALLRAQRLANDATGLANSLLGAGAGVDEPVLPQLGTIAAPTLLVAGALDAPYVWYGRELERAIPKARLVVVPDAGHAVHLERSGELAVAVADFLGGIPSVGGRWR
jgi:2-succinyl-6-hydroxy-2,4-cyclohexadiene-1-carboxylate synthase